MLKVRQTLHREIVLIGGFSVHFLGVGLCLLLWRLIPMGSVDKVLLNAMYYSLTCPHGCELDGSLKEKLLQTPFFP